MRSVVLQEQAQNDPVDAARKSRYSYRKGLWCFENFQQFGKFSQDGATQEVFGISLAFKFIGLPTTRNHENFWNCLFQKNGKITTQR